MKTLVIIPLLTLLSVLFVKTVQVGTHDSFSSNVQGYINQNHSCHASDECSSSGTEICTVGNILGGTQLFGKSSAGLCIIVLYKPN